MPGFVPPLHPPKNQPPPPPPPPQPFFLGRYSLATLLLECKQHFIANIFLVFLSLLALSSTPQSMVPALQRTTSTAQAFMPLIWLPPFNLELHSFVTLLIYPAFFLPFILVLIVWSCWNFHTICSPHLQLHCVDHLVGRFHCCQVSFLFSFPRQLTCLAQTTFWCILITSLPLFDAMNNRWSMCLMSSASLYSAFTCLKTRVSEKKIARRTMCLLTSTCPSSTARCYWLQRFYSCLPQPSQDSRIRHHIKGLLIICTSHW